MRSLAAVCHTAPLSVRVSLRGIRPSRTALPGLGRVHISATHWESMGVGEEGGSRREKGRGEGEKKIRRENKKGRGTCLIAVIYITIARTRHYLVPHNSTMFGTMVT